MLGLALIAGGLFTYSGLPTDGSYAADVLPGFILTAVGSGLAWASLFLAATTDVEVDEGGLASGLINTSQQIGSALGLAALATIAASRTADLLSSSPSPAQRADALYLFSGDTKPGDANGQGSTAFGAAWYALSPAGATITTAGSGSSGSGY